MVKLEGELYYLRGGAWLPGKEDEPNYMLYDNPLTNVETDDPDKYFAEYGYEYYGQVSELADSVPEEDFQASLSDAGTRIYTNPEEPGRYFLYEDNGLCVYKKIDDYE